MEQLNIKLAMLIEKGIIDATSFTRSALKYLTRRVMIENYLKLTKRLILSFLLLKKRKRISSKKRIIPWEYNKKFNPNIHIKRGYLDLKDNVVLNHRDCMRCFGYRVDIFQQLHGGLKEERSDFGFPNFILTICGITISVMILLKSL